MPEPRIDRRTAAAYRMPRFPVGVASTASVEAPIPTRILTRMLARMQRTHDRRRASFFVGPPGIGKSTAIEAFRRANPGDVIVTSILKRGVTGNQILQQFLLALRNSRGGYNKLSAATSELSRHIDIELDRLAGFQFPDPDPNDFPKLTIVFDEAQRLTNSAIDVLRDYNEPHYFCRGPFPIGMIFVGNNELSLEAGAGGASILDEGMQDRLLFRDRLTYDDVDREDVERFVEAAGITDPGATQAVVSAFSGPRAQRSFRRIADFLDDVRDEAGTDPVTRASVQAVLSLA